MTRVVERVANAFRRPFAQRTPWYWDLCDYYGVTPEQALALGTRQAGRRPDLPGSATTHSVSGRTFEEIWSSRLRETPANILRFYQEMGAWATFRQVVFHRDHQFAVIAKTINGTCPSCGGTGRPAGGMPPVSSSLTGSQRCSTLIRLSSWTMAA